MNGDAIVLSLPLLLLGSLLATAIITYLTRGWEDITPVFGALVTGGWALYLWTIDLSQSIRPLLRNRVVIDTTASVERLGFTLRLEPDAIPILAISLAIVTAAFVLALNIDQGLSFIPFTLVLTIGYMTLGLITVGPLSPVLVIPLLLALLSVVAIFILQASRHTSTAGPLRSLIPPLLAFPLFILAAWYIEQIPFNPQDITAAYTAAQLMATGLIILLAPMPLHGALPAISRNSPPVVAAMITLLYQVAILHLVFRTVNTFQFVPGLSPFGVWLTWAGLLTAVWGGFAGAGARHAGKLLGYSSMHDWGLIVLVLAVPGNRSWPLVLFMFGLRTVSLMTASAGMAVIERRTGGLDWNRLHGVGTRMPWNSAAYLIGGLGLCGFPLSAGFTGHWTALQVVAETDWRPAAVVLIASAGTILGYIRLARVLFGPLFDRSLMRETTLNVALAVVALMITFSFAFAPQLLDGPINRALVAFSS